MTARLLLILGPTASGKSALALEAAESFGGTVINADSMQVYRDLAVLTARPDAAMTARVPHRLYGFLDAAEICSAERWARLAAAEIERTVAEGRLPILTGGSGLYVRALTEGFSPIPDIAPEHRAAATRLLHELGGEGLHARLAEVDPASAVRLRPGDSQRLVRAFEVWRQTGRPLSEWQTLPPEPPKLDLPRLTVVLETPRDELYARADRRFEEMLKAGALDEVERLRRRGLDPGLPAMKALGVPHLIAHLEGRLTLGEAATLAQQETRRYAKRQGTWFRHQIIADHRIDAQDLERIRANLFPKISEFLLTGG